MTGRNRIQLDAPPSLATSYARALGGLGATAVRRVPVLGSAPGLSMVPGFADRDTALPATELVLAGTDVDPQHLHRYEQVCGLEQSDRLPITYPHVLAFPLSMELMTDPSFPFPVIGMVHIENEITQHRALVSGDPLELRVWADDLREHRRGTQFDICAEVRTSDAIAWESRSTYLYRNGGAERSSKSGPSSRSGGADSEPDNADIRATWDVPDDVGRRYGEVSGDRNPIHMHPLAARLFGMPRAIAHGMWVHARCLAAVEGHESDAASTRASFKLPLLLPARVAFSSWIEGGERRFSVRDADSGKPHLSGALAAG